MESLVVAIAGAVIGILVAESVSKVIKNRRIQKVTDYINREKTIFQIGDLKILSESRGDDLSPDELARMVAALAAYRRQKNNVVNTSESQAA